jgi:hypothetical protein
MMKKTKSTFPLTSLHHGKAGWNPVLLILHPLGPRILLGTDQNPVFLILLPLGSQMPLPLGMIEFFPKELY